MERRRLGGETTAVEAVVTLFHQHGKAPPRVGGATQKLFTP
jgi:hypothetical protein